VMRTHQIAECFGFDEDFAQMGFRVNPAK